MEGEGAQQYRSGKPVSDMGFGSQHRLYKEHYHPSAQQGPEEVTVQRDRTEGMWGPAAGGTHPDLIVSLPQALTGPPRPFLQRPGFPALM